MRDPAALEAALTLVHHPQMVRLAKGSPLPRGVAFVLEVAAGEAEALAAATAHTGRDESSLRAAAEFFVEQVLLIRQADSYRILGATADAPASELRRNMALLMRWLHPDVAHSGAASARIDRSVFANRVTRAWEDLKTDERRATYDTAHGPHVQAPRTGAETMSPRADNGNRAPERRHADPAPRQPARTRKRRRQLAMFRLDRESLMSRLFLYLRGDR